MPTSVLRKIRAQAREFPKSYIVNRTSYIGRLRLPPGAARRHRLPAAFPLSPRVVPRFLSRSGSAKFARKRGNSLNRTSYIVPRTSYIGRLRLPPPSRRFPFKSACRSSIPLPIWLRQIRAQAREFPKSYIVLRTSYIGRLRLPPSFHFAEDRAVADKIEASSCASARKGATSSSPKRPISSTTSSQYSHSSDSSSQILIFAWKSARLFPWQAAR